MLPDIGDPDGYQLCLWTGASYDGCPIHLDAGQTYDFIGGATRFEVIGIDPTLGLEPTDTTAFVTTLTFLTSGEFTGTQTPLLANVPEPASLALLGLGVLALLAGRESRPHRMLAAAAATALAGVPANAIARDATIGDLRSHIWCYRDFRDQIHQESYGRSPTTQRLLAATRVFDGKTGQVSTVKDSLWELDRDQASGQQRLSRYGRGVSREDVVIGISDDGRLLTIRTHGAYVYAAVPSDHVVPPIQMLPEAARAQAR